MWVMHKPGTCTAHKGGGFDNSSSNKKQGSFDKQAFTTKLKAKGASDTEIESKIEAIIAIMDS